VAWLRHAAEEVDRLYFDGELLPAFSRHYDHPLRFRVDKRYKHVAAAVTVNHGTNTVTLSGNNSMIHSLFRRKERGYHAGGVVCRDRLECFLQILIHEMIHLAFTVCEKAGHCSDEDFHGERFQQALRRLTGQTDILHGLYPGFEQVHDLSALHSRAREGMVVRVYGDDGATTEALLVTKHSQTVYSLCSLTPDKAQKWNRAAQVKNRTNQVKASCRRPFQVHPGLIASASVVRDPRKP